MNIRKNAIKVMASVLLAPVYAGCASTDVVDEPGAGCQEGEEITLNIGRELLAGETRAGSDHMLRFSAILYEGDVKRNDKARVLQRKEAIATSQESTRITFSVPVGSYSFIIVGDYIPSTSNPDDEGLYEDVYYDTSKCDEAINVRQFKDYKDKGVLEFNSINNDNYDCFATYIKMEKGEEQIVRDVILPRIVSKVRFISTSGLKKGASFKSINFNKFDFFYTYTPLQGVAGIHASNADINFKGLQLDKMSDMSGNELFYFYTLASTSSMLDRSLGEINFDVMYSDGTSWNVTVPSGLLKVTQNYITTVKGAMLWEPEVSKGDIILNISKNDGWSTSELEI